MTAALNLPKRTISLDWQGPRPTVEELDIYGGVLVTGAQAARDSGVTFDSICANMDTDDLVRFRSRLIEGFDTEKTAEGLESIASAAQWLVEIIEHEVGGRWVGYSDIDRAPH